MAGVGVILGDCGFGGFLSVRKYGNRFWCLFTMLTMHVTDPWSLIYCSVLVAGEREVKSNFQNLLYNRWGSYRRAAGCALMHWDFGSSPGSCIMSLFQVVCCFQVLAMLVFLSVARVVSAWKLIIFYLCKHELLVWKPGWNGWSHVPQAGYQHV